MTKAFTSWLLLVLAVGVVFPASAQTNPRAVMALPGDGGEKRVALVIGNSKYKSSPLRNPVNDARAMAKTLKDVGFEVILELNATRREMRRAMIRFGRRLENGGVGLFYYAGHGVQLHGNNYLIPVGAEIEAEDHVEIEAIELNQVLGRMGGARNRLNIVILDACRNNPFARKFRSATRGLAQTLAPAGTYVAYATAPGDVAEDGEGRNSLYTQALTQWMKRPGVKLEDVFKRVRGRVYKETEGRQVPWTSSSITGDFYFQPKQPKRVAAPNPQSSGPGKRTLDLAFWNSIDDSRNPSDFRAYLKRFPDGVFADLARNRIAALKPRPAARVPAPDVPRPILRTKQPPVAAAPKRPPDRVARPPDPKIQKSKPAAAKRPQLAAVDPSTKSKPQGGASVTGIWVGKDKLWKLKLSVNNGRVTGRLECAREETPLAGVGRGRTSGPNRTRISGTLTEQGRLEAETLGKRLNYRKLTGEWPNLRLWDAGDCGGANFVMRPADQWAKKNQRRVVSADPTSAAAPTTTAGFSGTWVGEDKLWKVQLTISDGLLRGRIECSVAEPAGGGRGSASNVGALSGKTVARLSGRVTAKGKVEAQTTGGDTMYRKLTGTLPKVSLWDIPPCGGGDFVLRRLGDKPATQRRQTASVGTTAVATSSKPLNPSGSWVGEDKKWKIELRIRNGKVAGSVRCNQPDGSLTGNADVNNSSDRIATAKVRGTIGSNGNVSAETVSGGRVLYRKLSGTFPNLKLWDSGQCGGAAFVMRRPRG